MFGKTRKGEDIFPDLGLVLILIITENRNRLASGTVHSLEHCFHYINAYLRHIFKQPQHIFLIFSFFLFKTIFSGRAVPQLNPFLVIKHLLVGRTIKTLKMCSIWKQVLQLSQEKNIKKWRAITSVNLEMIQTLTQWNIQEAIMIFFNMFPINILFHVYMFWVGAVWFYSVVLIWSRMDSVNMYVHYQFDLELCTF